MTQRHKTSHPDFIDRFYEHAGAIAKLTAEIATLSDEGLKLVETGKFDQAQANLQRCEELIIERQAAREKWHAYLRARGILEEE